MGADEDDPAAGGATVCNCGRSADDECGMTDPSECSVHGGAAAAPEADEQAAGGRCAGFWGAGRMTAHQAMTTCRWRMRTRSASRTSPCAPQRLS